MIITENAPPKKPPSKQIIVAVFEADDRDGVPARSKVNRLLKSAGRFYNLKCLYVDLGDTTATTPLTPGNRAQFYREIYPAAFRQIGGAA